MHQSPRGSLLLQVVLFKLAFGLSGSLRVSFPGPRRGVHVSSPNRQCLVGLTGRCSVPGRPSPSVKGTSRKRAAPYVER